MSRLDIDFTCEAKLYLIWLRLGLLLAGVALLVVLWMWARQLQVGIAQQSVQLQARQPAAASGKIDPHLADRIAVAARVQQSLQAPWLQALAQLEIVKSRYPGLQLLNVTPNRSKAEIIVTGEARQFDTITAFLQDLKKSAQFSDAVLQNQRLYEPENGRAPVYNFNAQLAWRLGEGQ
jgi:hypothetical protein